MRHDEFLGWPEYERAKVLAKLLHDDSLHTCGTRTADWYNADGRLVDPEPLEMVVRACHGCQLLDEAQERLKKSDSQSRYHLAWSKPS